MRKRLRVPVALAFTLTAAAACGGDDGGSGEPCGFTREPCTQDPHDMANVCGEDICVDSQGACPTGCIPAGDKFYCVPDDTQPPTCPSPTVCIVAGEDCPSGCTPVG